MINDTMQYPDLYTGQTLPNGAVVIVGERTDSHLSVVLAGYGRQYATWLFNHQTGGAGLGRYFESFIEAMENYTERVELRRGL